MVLNFLLNTQIIYILFNESIERYNQNQKPKKLIVFDDMIADMLHNKNLIR